MRKHNNNSKFFKDWTIKKLKDEWNAYEQMIKQIECYGVRDVMAQIGIGNELANRGCNRIIK
jgi:hypothetical protein